MRHCRGVLAVAEGARRAGIEGLIVPRECAREAALVDGVVVAGVTSLRGGRRDPARRADAASCPGARGAGARRPGRRAPWTCPTCAATPVPIRALTIAAAGAHNLLLSGPPGTGKTMLARCLPSILPPLSRAEAIAVTRIHSIAGLYVGGELIRRRPLRAPHHSISASGLVGGGPLPSPGEASLAHHGVLLLDELSEFSRSALEALRQPLEDGRVTIVRGQRTVPFPTRFQLAATTNPCPCGHAGDERCNCTEGDIARHRRKLSGPLLDRLDLLVDVRAPADRGAARRRRSTTSGAVARRRARGPRAPGRAAGGQRGADATPRSRRGWSARVRRRGRATPRRRCRPPTAKGR